MMTAVKALAIAVLATALYLPKLADFPVYLFHDEVRFALQGDAIARTGRDLNGRRMPVYFSEPGFAAGRDPLPIYLTALVLQVRPLSESAVRTGSALVGVLDIVLIFLLARALFGRDFEAFAAAGLLALTPTHFIHSRLGLSVIFPLPFVLLWLLLLVHYFRTPKVTTAFAAGCVLATGIYGYLAALVLMPIYAVATGIALARRKEMRALRVFAAGFALPLVFLVAWQVAHPERYRELIQSYRLYDADQLSPLQGMRDLSSYFSLGERTNVYWQAFNPGKWFFTGESSLIDSTRQVGAFLLATAVLLPLGLIHLLRERAQPFRTLLIAGLVTAPLPAVLVADDEIRRWLVIVPFVMVIATFGVARLRLVRQPWGPVAIAVLAIAALLQFAAFYRDYTSDYPLRSQAYFGGNVRDALKTALTPAPSMVYLSEAIPNVDVYWKLYARIENRDAIVDRAVDVSLDKVEPQTPAGDARLVVPVSERDAVKSWEGAGWRIIAEVANRDGAVGFLVLSRP